MIGVSDDELDGLIERAADLAWDARTACLSCALLGVERWDDPGDAVAGGMARLASEWSEYCARTMDAECQGAVQVLESALDRCRAQSRGR